MEIILESVGVPTYTGGHFNKVHPEADYYLDGVLYKYKYVTFEGGRFVKVGKVPFIPTFTCVKRRIHGCWYICNELTAQENKELALSYTHWEGSFYRQHVNRHASQAWIAWFFYRHIEKEGE
jgi:hypothetical protein